MFKGVVKGETITVEDTNYLFKVDVIITDEAVLRSINMKKLTKYLRVNGWTEGKATLESATAIMFSKPICSMELIIVEPGIKPDHIDKHVVMKRALRGIARCHEINQFQALHEIEQTVL